MVPNLTGRPHDSGDAADLSIMGYAKSIDRYDDLMFHFAQNKSKINGLLTRIFAFTDYR